MESKNMKKVAYTDKQAQENRETPEIDNSVIIELKDGYGVLKWNLYSYCKQYAINAPSISVENNEGWEKGKVLKQGMNIMAEIHEDYECKGTFYPEILPDIRSSTLSFAVKTIDLMRFYADKKATLKNINLGYHPFLFSNQGLLYKTFGEYTCIRVGVARVINGRSLFRYENEGVMITYLASDAKLYEAFILAAESQFRFTIKQRPIIRLTDVT